MSEKVSLVKSVSDFDTRDKTHTMLWNCLLTNTNRANYNYIYQRCKNRTAAVNRSVMGVIYIKLIYNKFLT